ncbi:protein kintoun [Prorops nasuta]|uniref:protein kintoun n=1 Tax=Prorops nasuta TaxID=863751 RepID=UPI0034CF559F
MDAYEARKREWENLDITKEELKSLTECLKKEEFRKLLSEYADEVTDPENRKLYEKEITQLEKARGVDVTFINPEAGYVIKTSVNDEQKCFINISKSDIVARPTSQPTYEGGHRGLQWSIPYTLIPPRDDLDKKNVRCTVFDVVFHPDTIYLASKNIRFKEIVNNTAMDGVENTFKVRLDRKNLKFPKMSFKGLSHPSVIRKPSKDPPNESLDMEPEIYQKIMSSYDESREKQFHNEEDKSKRASPPKKYYKTKENTEQSTASQYTTPKFVIKYSSDIEMNDFLDTKDAKLHAAMPKKLVIVIDLPLLSRASDASLDVQERYLHLTSETPAKYQLHLPLSYSVDADEGDAKFDSKLKKLTVTLPVVHQVISLTDGKEDSGVDSDHDAPQIVTSSDPNDNISQEEPDLELTTESVKCDHSSKIIELSDKQRDTIECEDITLRTKELQEPVAPFMIPKIKYNLPTFTCNIYNNQLAITVNVKNADPDSISHRILDNNIGIHILLTSIGAGFFPLYYSICLKLEDNTLNPNNVSIEPWDNNVVFTIEIVNPENLSRYYVGLDEEIMEHKDLPVARTFQNELEELMAMPEEQPDQNVKVKMEDGNVVISINQENRNQLDSDDEEENQNTVVRTKKERKHQGRKSKLRSVSESSGDELTCSNNSSIGGRSKGILKSRSSNFSRSYSESSADESLFHASSLDFHDDFAHDFNSESDCSSLKKTVRFNDVVSRKLFRSNSSILGQRKKNQRKLKNKKRAHDRRLSESENSETEERDKYKVDQIYALSEGATDNVKPILNRDKQPEQKRTANIKIEQKLSSHKRISNSEEEKVDKEAIKGSTESSVQAEFKSDLIFDLDF